MLLCESPVSSLHSRISGFQNSSGFRSKNGVEFFPYMSVTKALIEMMEEMPFEDIKVKELCDRAMIRKSTFYKHFADKYELLAFIVKEVINDYNAYTEDDLLIGLADEVTLPKIKNKTTTVNGMGIAGDVDSPVPGQFESMEATLNWNTMYSFATKMMNPNKNIQITLRAAMQNDNKNGGYTYKGLRVVLGGRPKELDPGKLKRADTMGSTTTLEVTRYLMEVDGQTVIDIDKFAGRYYVDGEDMRAEINALI